MNRILSILVLFILVTFSIDLNSQKRNEEESNFLNEQFEDKGGEFDFSRKTASFFWATRLWDKDEFFENLKESLESGQQMSIQFILLTNKQKKKSGGYDVFIYSWNKFLISKKQVGSHINRLKKQGIIKCKIIIKCILQFRQPSET